MLRRLIFQVRYNKMDIKTRVCTKCKIEKSTKEFYKATNNKTGLSYWCIDCSKRHVPPESGHYLKMGTKTKVCKRCKVEKLVEEFHKQTKSKDGLSGVCKKCYHIYYSKYSEAQRNKFLLKTYGIDQAEYDSVLKSQNNVCAICGKTELENGRRLSVDHSHVTGEVRGLLCKMCNKGIGMFEDSVEVLESAIKYLAVKV